jgi:hypothetical protein
LRVAIDPHRVVGVGADEVALEAAGGVEDEELDARPPRADRGDERVERRGIRDVRSDGERGAARSTSAATSPARAPLFRYVNATSKPRRASSRAVAAPIPREPPVMTATRRGAISVRASARP